MRIPKPHWKKSHKCYYVKIGKTFHRLDPDETKAREMWQDLLSKQNIKDGTTPSRNIPVRDLLYLFLEWVHKHRAYDTYKWYRKYLHGNDGQLKNGDGTTSKSKYAEAGFANFVPAKLSIRDLKPFHLENWLDSRYAGADSDTVCAAIKAVTRALNWGRDDMGYIDKNPLTGFKRPFTEGRGADAYLTPDQWEKLIDAIKDGCHDVEPFLDYVTVMKETGCRPQEIRKVEARHLDHTHKRWVFPNEENPKARKREKRIVMLGDEAYRICRRLAVKYPEGPLFRNCDGKAWTNFAVSCRCRRLSEKLGFKVFAYAIRHTFATEAIINGANVITIARLMGHKDLTMLNRIYQHVMEDKQHLEETRQRATERLGA